MTNPPKTVLISGIPLCFAYGENSRTKKLAHAAKTTYQLSVLCRTCHAARRTENSTKKMYSTTYLPPALRIPNAEPHEFQSWHACSASWPQQQKLLFRYNWPSPSTLWQYPVLRSASQSLATSMNAAIAPLRIPAATKMIQT